jgi:hypothetical protein
MGISEGLTCQAVGRLSRRGEGSGSAAEREAFASDRVGRFRLGHDQLARRHEEAGRRTVGAQLATARPWSTSTRTKSSVAAMGAAGCSPRSRPRRESRPDIDSITAGSGMRPSYS